MAEINTRKRGNKWEYRFEGATIDGKRNQISKSGFNTKKEALQAGTKALAEYNSSGLVFEPSNISVADYLDYWFEIYCMVELKYSTHQGYLGIINNHLKPQFGHYKLQALTPASIQEYLNQLKYNEYSKSSIVGVLTTLSGALNYAVSPLNFLSKNPAEYVKIPKIERKPRERIIFTIEDFQRLIDRFPFGNRYHILLQIGWNCGLRISETCALTWDDIDLENKTITIDKQIVKRNFGIDVRKSLELRGKKQNKSSWYFTTTKTDNSRTIKIGDVLTNFLKSEKIRQKKNELSYGEYYTIYVKKKEKDEKGNDIIRLVPTEKLLDINLGRANFICVNENGELTSPDTFKHCSKIIHYELMMAFDYHSLRHTHATMLIENGVSPKTVQMRLGHSKIETTLQTYVHSTDTMEQNAMDIFDSVINDKLSTK